MNRKMSRAVLGPILVLMLGVCYGVQRDTALASSTKRAH